MKGDPGCVAAFSQRRGVFDATIKCGVRARWIVGGDQLCVKHARRRCKVLGLPFPPTAPACTCAGPDYHPDKPCAVHPKEVS
jgi:hypothetical protein